MGGRVAGDSVVVGGRVVAGGSVVVGGRVVAGGSVVVAVGNNEGGTVCRTEYNVEYANPIRLFCISNTL